MRLNQVFFDHGQICFGSRMERNPASIFQDIEHSSGARIRDADVSCAEFKEAVILGVVHSATARQHDKLMLSFVNLRRYTRSCWHEDFAGIHAGGKAVCNRALNSGESVNQVSLQLVQERIGLSLLN